MYVFGGNYCSDDETQRSNDIYSTWLCIPKLSELCWDALIFYFPHMYKCNVDKLIDIGVPKRYLDRISIKDMEEC